MTTPPSPTRTALAEPRAVTLHLTLRQAELLLCAAGAGYRTAYDGMLHPQPGDRYAFDDAMTRLSEQIQSAKPPCSTSPAGPVADVDADGRPW